MTRKQFKMNTHKTLAGFMAIWLSGVIFLLCCHVQNTLAAGMESCPLVKLGAHCDKAYRDSEKVEKQSNDQGMDCCAFIPTLFDKNRTIDANQQVAVAAPTTTVVKPRLVRVRTNFAPAYPYLSTVLLKNNTFLKNRTFRI